VIQTGQPPVLAKDSKANSTSKPQILAAYGRLPLSFEANLGQTPAGSMLPWERLLLVPYPTESVLALRKSKKPEVRSQKSESEPRP
jgi:hypothetical protein